MAPIWPSAFRSQRVAPIYGTPVISVIIMASALTSNRDFVNEVQSRLQQLAQGAFLVNALSGRADLTQTMVFQTILTTLAP
jgi:hypothetical protein